MLCLFDFPALLCWGFAFHYIFLSQQQQKKEKTIENIFVLFNYAQSEAGKEKRTKVGKLQTEFGQECASVCRCVYTQINCVK